MLAQWLTCGSQVAVAALGIICVARAEEREMSSISRVWPFYQKKQMSSHLLFIDL